MQRETLNRNQCRIYLYMQLLSAVSKAAAVPSDTVTPLQCQAKRLRDHGTNVSQQLPSNGKQKAQAAEGDCDISNTPAS